MKRPVAFVLVCWWFGFGSILTSGPSANLLFHHRGPVTEAPPEVLAMQLVLVAVAIFLIRGLWNMHAVALWIVTGLLGLWAAIGATRLPSVLAAQPGFRLAASMAALVLGNSLAAIYLGRPGFRSFAGGFREDLAAVGARRLAEKSIRELGKGR